MSQPGAVSSAASPHNDWSRIRPAEPGQSTPPAQVTVCVVGGGDPSAAARTTAALAQQRHPAELLQVVTCADDNGFVDLVAAATSEIIVRIPAGAVPGPDLVGALARWPQADPDAVGLAVPARFGGTVPEPEMVAAHASAGTLGQLFAGSAVDAGLTRRLEATHQLRTADHTAFLTAAGTAFAFHRSRYRPGTDPYQGADVEVAYRLAQAGAVFVPEPTASLWTLVPTDPAGDDRQARAALTDLLPYPRQHRDRPGRTWQVPLICAMVPVDQPYEVVRACVDRLLASDERDLQVALVADWAAAGPTGGGDQPDDLRLLAAEYRHEPRVRLVDTAPASAYPSPYLLRVPARLGVGRRTVGAVTAAMEKWRCGLLRVLPAGAGSATYAVELWSTAARCRATNAGTAEDALVEAVAASHGQRWETGSEFDVVDLATAGPGAADATTTAAPRRAAKTVPVGGARSLGRATVFVARQYARGVRRRLVSR
ncbi:hypothetical protein O7608_07075 [Solwaraspora sp. WMMA2056]|uniref:hypothetical protein n=1 Tax=Solwaraspora sp. WMMA2056 TaxID=3015161 RepID=UPI00259B517E|nr:hypothetical protein [Solwaraspora sp. WMMA2056]WJK42143.1 hypothetical protein O7608_07075 [Solwaraspora sp. WMMA2056]